MLRNNHIPPTGAIVNTTTLRVRYADTDKMQIVYNGVYLEYFEVGRTEMLRACGIPYVELERHGYLLPVLEASVCYRAPARYDDILAVEAGYDPTPQPLLRIGYTIRRDETVIATGFTVHSFVKADTMRPVKPPKIYTEAIEQFLQSTSPGTVLAGEPMIR